MTIQLSIFNAADDFKGISLHRENNKHSEEILINSESRLSKNCKIIYDSLQRGERLTGMDIIQKYGMSEYRRRIKDLRQAGINIKESVLQNGCKIWWIEK